MIYEIIVRKVCVIVRSANQMFFAILPFANHGELFGQLFPPHIRLEPAIPLPYLFSKV